MKNKIQLELTEAQTHTLSILLESKIDELIDMRDHPFKALGSLNKLIVHYVAIKDIVNKGSWQGHK